MSIHGHTSPEQPTSIATTGSVPAVEPRIDERIERTLLEIRTAALERSLEQSERRRQAVVHQYELLLEEAREEARSAEDRSRIEQLLERVR